MLTFSYKESQELFISFYAWLIIRMRRTLIRRDFVLEKERRTQKFTFTKKKKQQIMIFGSFSDYDYQLVLLWSSTTEL